MQTLPIVLTLSYLKTLHDALREIFLKVTDNEMWTTKTTRKPGLGAHWFQITVTCVRQRNVGRDEK